MERIWDTVSQRKLCPLWYRPWRSKSPQGLRGRHLLYHSGTGLVRVPELCAQYPAQGASKLWRASTESEVNVRVVACAREREFRCYSTERGGGCSQNDVDAPLRDREAKLCLQVLVGPKVSSGDDWTSAMCSLSAQLFSRPKCRGSAPIPKARSPELTRDVNRAAGVTTGGSLSPKPLSFNGGVGRTQAESVTSVWMIFWTAARSCYPPENGNIEAVKEMCRRTKGEFFLKKMLCRSQEIIHIQQKNVFLFKWQNQRKYQ